MPSRLRSLILDQSEGIRDNPDFQQLRLDYNQSCEHLAKELLGLEKLVKFAIIGQTVDAFVETVEPLDRMVKAATTTLKVRLNLGLSSLSSSLGLGVSLNQLDQS